MPRECRLIGESLGDDPDPIMAPSGVSHVPDVSRAFIDNIKFARRELSRQPLNDSIPGVHASQLVALCRDAQA